MKTFSAPGTMIPGITSIRLKSTTRATPPRPPFSRPKRLANRPCGFSTGNPPWTEFERDAGITLAKLA